jgi:plasmid stabilization system protein ParE
VRVVWSSQADQQVTEAVEFIASDRPSAARRWLEGMLEQVKSLAAFPDSGRVVPELEQDDVRELLLDPDRIVYRRGTDLVEVVTVWHMRREFPVDALE